MKDGRPIDGLIVTPLREIADTRGAVLHMLRADAPEFRQFGECYFSEVNPGVIKAWKYHRRQTQNLAVPTGRVRFAFFDSRPASPTLGHIQVLELGRPDAYWRVQIPPLLWYGFKCLSDHAALVANCVDIPHDSAESHAIAFEMLESADAIEALRDGGAHA
jgi:dTDP-4-dehydrorhamnose 3,5-epimerase